MSRSIRKALASLTGLHDVLGDKARREEDPEERAVRKEVEEKTKGYPLYDREAIKKAERVELDRSQQIIAAKIKAIKVILAQEIEQHTAGKRREIQKQIARIKEEQAKDNIERIKREEFERVRQAIEQRVREVQEDYAQSRAEYIAYTERKARINYRSMVSDALYDRARHWLLEVRGAQDTDDVKQDINGYYYMEWVYLDSRGGNNDFMPVYYKVIDYRYSDRRENLIIKFSRYNNRWEIKDYNGHSTRAYVACYSDKLPNEATDVWFVGNDEHAVPEPHITVIPVPQESFMKIAESEYRMKSERMAAREAAPPLALAPPLASFASAPPLALAPPLATLASAHPLALAPPLASAYVVPAEAAEEADRASLVPRIINSIYSVFRNEDGESYESDEDDTNYHDYTVGGRKKRTLKHRRNTKGGKRPKHPKRSKSLQYRRTHRR
jgi:hypothetical protein